MLLNTLAETFYSPFEDMRSSIGNTVKKKPHRLGPDLGWWPMSKSNTNTDGPGPGANCTGLAVSRFDFAVPRLRSRRR
eukprot:1263544-Rhodomonas_salina.2